MSDTPIFDEVDDAHEYRKRIENHPVEYISVDNTPNVVITNPDARKIAGIVLDITGVILGLIVTVDAAAPGFDVGAITVPALAGWAFLRAAFGLGITTPNVPPRV